MGKTVEKAKKKGKKKGRPSLLDLQKRSLRLAKQLELGHQQQKNRSPNPNPYLRPVPPTAGRRPSRRSSNPEEPETADEDEEEYEDEDEEGGGRRREKKLQHVLRATPDGRSGDRGELEPSGSESEGEDRAEIKRRRVDAVGAVRGSTRDKIGSYKSYAKVTDPSQGETSDLEDGTPLPDTQLLVFILDRLQKKDTYGVFSEPVDPEELPDYHDIIDHPMDFSTVRKKLDDGDYKNLEQFEKDVFLISSNAMHYNAPDTIYFRQARAIQELAKKDFENLRQDTDEDELEPQTARRGRPPSKSAGKKPIDRSAALFGSSNNSSVANAIERNGKCTTLADTSRKGSVLDKSYQCNTSSTRASQGPRNIEKSHFSVDLKFDRNDDPLGSVMKGLSSRYCKKAISSEDNRRNSYNQPSSASSAGEPSILTTFDGEAKELIPVGLHMEHAYARSLARFAANLGPIGWNIAAEKIKKVLPPGTKFGRGWISEDDAAPQYQPPILPTSMLPPCLRSDSPAVTESHKEPEKLEGAIENLSGHISHSSPAMPAGMDKMSDDAKKTREISGCNDDKVPNVTGEKLEGASEKFPSHIAHASPAMPAGTKTSEAKQTTEISGCKDGKVKNVDGIQLKPPVEFHQTIPVQSNINGLNARFAYNLSQFEMMPNSEGQIGSLGGKLPMTYARGMDLGNKSNLIHIPATTQVEIDKSKYSLASSSNSSFEPSGSSHLDSERGKVESRNTIRSNFFVPASTTQIDAERARLSVPSTVGPGSSFANSVSASRFQMETKMSNPVTNSISDTLAGHFGTQRLMENSQSSVNVSNNISKPAPVNCLDMDRTKARNIGSASSSIDSFNHQNSFNNFEIERSKLGNLGYMNSSYYYIHPTGTSQMIGGDASNMNPNTNSMGEPVLESQGPWRGSSLNQKSDSAPPDLNVRFQPPGSPASSALVDSQQPDLALQL